MKIKSMLSGIMRSPERKQKQTIKKKKSKPKQTKTDKQNSTNQPKKLTKSF